MASVNAAYFAFIDNQQLLTTAVDGQRVPRYLSRSYVLEQQRRVKLEADAQRSEERAAERERRRLAESIGRARDHERRAAEETARARAHVAATDRAYAGELVKQRGR